MQRWNNDRTGPLIFLTLATGVLALCLTLRLRGDTNVPGPGTPGRYTARAQGYGGPVEVILTVNKNGGLEQVAVTAPDETPAIGQAAAPQVAAAIARAQTWQVDDIAGATRTSRAVRKAARDAMTQAGWPAG